MRFCHITALYFSATGTTEKMVTGLAKKIAEHAGGSMTVDSIDFTPPEARKRMYSFDKDSLVVAGLPVYAGRVPNVLLKF